VAVIEDWVITTIFVLPLSFWNVVNQVPDPGGIAIVQTQACCCVPDSSYVHTPAVAGEQDFFVTQRGAGIVEVRRGFSTKSAAQMGVGVRSMENGFMLTLTPHSIAMAKKMACLRARYMI